LWASAKPERPVEREVPDDPPAQNFARDNPFARSPSPKVVLGPYQSIQVNVDALGQNIVGDAANEPSIAVNPANPANIVIGWRQFDSVASNFRQAGWAYSFNGGQTWTFPGVLQPGVFRSDPVLDANLQGTFFYQSLKGDFTVDVYRSTNGGVSWLAPVTEFGGDKNWFVVDKSGGTSSGHLYGIWQRFASCCGANVFTRSTNGGSSFQSPVTVAKWPTFGTLAVGPFGEVYAAGIDGTTTQDFGHFVVAKSVNASNPSSTPTFGGARVNFPGGMGISEEPNPAGLLGQAGIAVDHSSGPTRGDAYVAASVSGADPADVIVVRSTDGGSTWSAPVRVNDDPSQDNWQWFAAHSVAPNGRIDVIWNDSRDSGQANLTQLYYAYSWDGGVTWSPNVAVSPVFDSFLGYPNQSKMGDYIGIVSAATGADVAYTATFNHEQDVYYVRVFPDCNGNGISDVTDIANATSADCNLDHIPDECRPTICGPSLAVVSIVPADTCPAGGPGAGSGSVDPGEDAALNVTLRNDSSVDLTGVTATLATTTPGVTVTRATASFPNLAVEGAGTSVAPGFAFTVDAGVACGDSVAFTLTVSANQGQSSTTLSVRVGLPATSTGTFDSTDAPKAINDLSTVTSSLVLPAGGDLVDLDVGLDLTHTYDGDLVIVLVGPDGRRNLLAYSEGDAGQNYTGTIFDDEAAPSIDAGIAPFTGHFRPRQALSSFDGTPSTGTWTLEIQDIGPGDTGTLTGWSLRPTLSAGHVCNACNVSAPTLEPVTVSWNAGKTSLAWESIFGATFYDTFRGARAGLPGLLGPSADSCLRVSTIPTTTGSVLTEMPPTGELYWYLVRAGNGGGLGPAGSATAGPRSQDSTGACP
jgi:subtilisin-like proprotein convertase family protein